MHNNPAMRMVQDLEAFIRNPVGTWIATRTTVVWVHSPTLCGAICWGTSDEVETRQVIRCLDAFPQLAPHFDVLLDGRAIEGIEPAAMEALLGWARGRLEELNQRIRNRVGVIPGGLHGMMLAGITPVLHGPGVDHIVGSAREGCQQLLGEGGEALHAELEEIVKTARETPPWLLELRALLGAHQGSLSLNDAARRLTMAPRSLQRALGKLGRSFRDEQCATRFRAAATLLATDEKLYTVAARLGLTEAGLALLVRRHAGVTPGVYRRVARRAQLSPAHAESDPR